MKHYLAIDIGGTFIKYSIINERFEIEQDGSKNTPKDPETFLKEIKNIVLSFVSNIEGIAICMAGFINPDTGENTDFSIGENFKKYNLKYEISKLCNLPVVIENDSNCAALGEQKVGAGSRFHNYCLLTIGTGIGGGIILNRKLYRGSHYKAGEAGLTLLTCNKKDKENVGNVGGTSALVLSVSKYLQKEVDGVYVFEHLNESEIFKIYNSWVEKVAILIGNLAMVYDPEAILIGGAVCKQKRFMVDLSTCVYDLYPHLKEYTIIKACETGNHAGRLGALSLLLDQ